MATAGSKAANDEVGDNTKPPFLRRVRIRGYKSIEFCDVTLEPLTVLVGRNASGKSNFLDALAFLGDAMETSVTEAVKRHGGWSTVVSRGSDAPRLEFEIESHFAADDCAQKISSNGSVTAVRTPPNEERQDLAARYLITISGGERKLPFIEEESLEISGNVGENARGFKVHRFASESRSESILSMAYGKDNPKHPADTSRVDLLRADHCVLGSIGDPLFASFADGIRHMGYHNAHPGAMRLVPKPSNGSFLEKDANNLASVIRHLNEVDPVSLERVKQYVRHIVQEVSDFWVQAYGERETVRFRVRSSAGSTPSEFDAESMSDGTLRVLANIMAAFQNVPPYGYPSVVGIEEPETSLHPAAMNALVDALDEATTHTQILLTTHSAELLDNPTIKPENVRVVEMIDGRTVIGPVDEASIEIVQRKLDTLGGLERQNQLGVDIDDRERQLRLAENGQERHE